MNVLLDIKDKLFYCFLWLYRIRDCRGFGVQSPTAYSFIRYVINEHYPYYAYNDLRERHKNIRWSRRKMLELYFRLSNYRQADRMVCYLTVDTEYKDLVSDYEKAACPSTVVDAGTLSLDGVGIVMFQTPVMLFNDAGLLSALDSHTLLVIENIHSSSVNREAWNDIVADERTGRTFDLYYCGIVFMDKSKYKEHFCVNF